MKSEQLRIVFLFEELTALKIPLVKITKDYLNYIESTANLSANTILNYGRHLKDFIAFCKTSHIRTIEQVKPKTIFDYLHHLKNQDKASPTIYAAFEAIKMLVKFAALEGIKGKYFTQIFCIRSPKVSRGLPRILRIDQVEKLLDVPIAKDGFRLRDIAILELLYGAGIREGELVRLKLSDIDLVSGLVMVLGKGSKQRLLPLTGTISQAIKKYIITERRAQARSGKSQGFLFLSRTGRPLRRHDIWRTVSKYAKRKGLQNVSPHTLRHCFATHLFSRGADLRLIQTALGHSSLSTTELYTHVDVSQLKRAFEKYHPRK